jgi:hypothetical protein
MNNEQNRTPHIVTPDCDPMLDSVESNKAGFLNPRLRARHLKMREEKQRDYSGPPHRGGTKCHIKEYLG